MGIIRLLLALSVVLTHSYSFFGINLLGGPLAVQAFFIISGFYMSLILNEKYVNQNNSYKLFITNRFMRIFPIYLCVVLIAILFSAFSYLYPTEPTEAGSPFVNTFAMYKDYNDISLLTLSFLILANIFIFFQDVVMFLGIDTSGTLFFTSNFKFTDPQLYKFLFIPQAWTVSLELTFYLIAPFLVRRNSMLIIFIILLSFALRFLTYSIGIDNDPWTYRFFPFELGYFLLGNISYYIYTKIRTFNPRSNYFWIPFLFILFLTAGYPVLKFDSSQYIYCLLFSICLPFIFHLTKDWKYDAYIGDLSYPVYLVHILVLAVVNYISIYLHQSIIGTVYLIGVFALSIFLNEIISRRIETIRQRRVKAVKNKEIDTSIKVDPLFSK